ncbi:MAG: iron ABC transporter permease [Actinomycetota bacterium]
MADQWAVLGGELDDELEEDALERWERRAGDVTIARRVGGMLVLGFLVALGALLSLAVGANSIAWSTVVDALFRFDDSVFEHLMIREFRVPRTYLGVLVGAALGTAGAVMQGVTRNPLAGPGILGVNAGASFAVVIALWWVGIGGTLILAWFAFVGAGVTSVFVYVLGTAGRAGATPIRLALAGAATAALLGAWTGAIVLRSPSARLNEFRFWAVGSLTGAGRTDEVLLWQLAPIVAVGLILAFGVARQLNTIALGDDTARALGTRLGATRLLSVIAITLLCGGAVSVAGPIGFVGLVVPHVARLWFGPDQRWLLPGSALAGSAFLLYCDIAGRIVARPGEIQVGIMTAVIGGPAFIFLVRRTRMTQL